MKAEEGVREEIRAECFEVLEEAVREAHEAFARYRAEGGIPGPREGRADKASLAPVGEERRMDEATCKARELDALENIAAELERLRILREHAMGVRVEGVEGNLFVRPNQRE